MKKKSNLLSSCKKIIAMGLLLIIHNCFASNNKIDNELKQSELPFYYPSTLSFGNGSTIMTPTGYGASSNTVFAGAGVALRQVYSNQADGGASFGIGLGNPFQNIGIVLFTRMNDISDQDNYSYGFKVHKYIGKGTSIGFGGTHLLKKAEADGNESLYVVASHTFQNLYSKHPGRSLFTLSIGIGNGRFAKKSPRDITEGKGKYGTSVFGSIAYSLSKKISIIGEWSGLNLNTGFSAQPFNKIPFQFTLGLVDLTSNSGDGIRMTISGGISFKPFNK